jgi:putative aldouronate transport system permease protein
MWGVLISFQDYNAFQGFLGSPWVGLKHFRSFFGDRSFTQLFANTITISLMQLIFNFPMPIIFALMLNEIRNQKFKKLVQTLTYLPHFMSSIVVAGMAYIFLTTEGGIINEAIAALGFQKINFLASERMFRPMLVGLSMWKGTGWGTIIYLAALSGVDVEQYEASRIDGANRIQQLWYITLPAIKSTIITLLILRLGDVLDTGFDTIFALMNEMNRSVAEVFDTYVYKVGITNAQLSYSTAVGLFKSLVGLILVVGTDRLAKRVGEEGIL